MANIRSYFPAFRVFVFGVDVTEDVTNVTVNLSGSKSRAPSTAEVELLNGGSRANSERIPTDRYVVTREDIQALYGVDSTLDKIAIPTTKEVLRELREEQTRLSSRSDEDTPSLVDALATVRPDLVTGDPVNDLAVAQGYARRADVGGEEALRQEALRRQASSIAEERRQAIIETEVAQRQDELERLVASRINSQVRDPVKRDVLLRKYRVRQSIDRIIEDERIDYDTRSLAGLAPITGEVMRYPFQTGDSIFHSNDMVRIFFRDPRPGQLDNWYHMFAGFVSDTVDSVDQDDQRILRLRFEDASRTLRYARLTTNPGVFDIDDVRVATDAASRTFYNDGFTNLTLPQLLTLVIFGAEAANVTQQQGGDTPIERVQSFGYVRYGVNADEPSESTVPTDGVGAYDFLRSALVVVGERTEEEGIEGLRQVNIEPSQFGAYQALVDHRVRITDLDNMALRDVDTLNKVEALKQYVFRNPDDGSYAASDVVDIIGRHPELFPTDAGRLIMLMPGSLGPNENRDLLLRDIAGVDTLTTFRTRLSLIYDVMERIDFQFYASPKGDLLCEMPLYDFEPSNWDSDTSFEAVALRSNNPPFYETEGERFGPYGPGYRIAKRDTISWERSFTDENIITQMVGVRTLIKSYTSIGDGRLIGEVLPVNLYGLMPQFGIRSETVEPTGLLSSPEAARLYAAARMNQINADARRADVQVLPAVQLAFPNRPIEFAERDFIGTIDEVTHNIVWGLQGDMSTSMRTSFLRAWGGQLRDGELVYEPIGGFASQGLNYAQRFGSSEPDSNTGGTE